MANVKSVEQRRIDTRKGIFITYVIGSIVMARTVLYSDISTLNPEFVISLLNRSIILWALFSAFIMFYTLDLKNVSGWWAKKRFKAEQKIKFKKEVEAQVANQMGMGYDKIER